MESVNILIESEKINGKTIYIASSPDVNVFVEAPTVEEVKKKFIEAVKHHLKTFPEERPCLTENKKEIEMPMITKVFL